MDREPFTVLVLINSHSFAETLIDSGCLSNGLYNPRFARRNRLTRLKIILRQVTGINGKLTDVTDEVVAIELDLDNYK
jgi:hypothetical protein